MSHSFFLGVQVSLVVWVGSDFDRYVFYNFQSVSFQSHAFHRIVGQQAHFVDTNLTQNLSTYSVVAFVGLMAQADVGVYRIHAFFLQLVGFHFFHKSDATSYEESQVYEADGKAAALVASNNAEQLNKDSGELINGLYAAGPILSAAVDGEGVLSGNELTEAVMFGSTAGTEAAVYVSDNQ